MLCLSFKLKQLNGFNFKLMKAYFDAFNKNYVINKRHVCLVCIYIA